jgi:hypothetical protein
MKKVEKENIKMKTMVYKSPEFIQYPSCASANVEKIVNLAIAQISDSLKPKDSDAVAEVEDKMTVKLDLEYCLSMLNHKSTNKKSGISKLIKYLESSKIIRLVDTSTNKKGVFVFGEGYEINTKRNVIKLGFAIKLRNMLFVKDENGNMITQFIKYDLRMFNETNSGSIIRLYELFRLQARKTTKSYFETLEKLKKMLEMDKNKSYAEYKIFKNRVLLPALEYINKFTDITVEIRDETKISKKVQLKGKDGNPILDKDGNPKTRIVPVTNSLVFDITYKKDMLNYTNVEELTRQIVEISGLPAVDIDADIKMIANKLRNRGEDVEDKQVAELFKKCRGDRDLLLAIVRKSFISKTRKLDVMKYAYGLAKQASANPDKKTEFVNSLESLRVKTRKEIEKENKKIREELEKNHIEKRKIPIKAITINKKSELSDSFINIVKHQLGVTDIKLIEKIFDSCDGDEHKTFEALKPFANPKKANA